MRLRNPLSHILSAPSLTAEGNVGYETTRKAMRYHDGVRERFSSEMGYMPFAYPVGGSPTLTTTTNLAIAANGGTIAMPVVLDGHMLLQSVSYWDTATATARGPVEFALFEDRLNNANALDVVSGAVGSLASYTPSAASLRTISVTSPPIYLAPGCYWLVIKNNHASNALQMGGAAAGTMAVNAAQTKTLTTAAFGATLDLVAATWTKINQVPGVRLNGRIAGQAVAF